MATMDQRDDPDKKGDELKAQRFQMLADIAKELSGEVVFPTYFDAVLRLRKALHDPEISITNLAQVISTEPLISAKLLHLANSAAFNSSGQQILDLKSAIIRLGLNAVHTASLSIVMTQLMRAKGMAEFADTTHALWEHSIQTSAAAYVLAQEMTRLNRDEAMLAGLIHDLGAFYMLYRATQYSALRERPGSMRFLIAQWHENIGLTVLNALGMPEEIIEAVRDHDVLRPIPERPKNLNDIVYIGNLLVGGREEWMHLDMDNEELQNLAMDDAYLALQDEILVQTAEMRAIFN